MKTRAGHIVDEDALAAAQRWFPASSLRIRQLLVSNETFRELCSDLAAAERTLATVEQLPAHIRNERRAEFTELAEDLAAEIKVALSHPQNPNTE